MTLEQFCEPPAQPPPAAPAEPKPRRKSTRSTNRLSWDAVKQLVSDFRLHFRLTAGGQWFLSAEPPPGLAEWGFDGFDPPRDDDLDPTAADLEAFASAHRALDVVRSAQGEVLGIRHDLLVPSPNWGRLKRLCRAA